MARIVDWIARIPPQRDAVRLTADGRIIDWLGVAPDDLGAAAQGGCIINW